MTALDIREVAARISNGGPVRRSAGSYQVKCPSHDDIKASLNISPGDTQPVVLHCHAGCEPDDILAAVGLTWDMVSNGHKPPPAGEWTPGGPATAVYDYHDEHGTLLFQVLRTANKDFFQRTPDPTRKSGYRWKMDGVRRVIYRLPQVLECAAAGTEVWIGEGEKDALTLVAHGLCGTTSPAGAGKWHDDYGEWFRDASVTVVADTDESGRRHARTIRDSVLAHGAMRCRIVEAAHGKDATDHLTAGKTVDEFRVTVPYEEVEKPDLAMDVDEYLGQQLPAQQYVIEGTLARGEVMLLTGYEGKGKSTWVKQTAVQCAWGIHPWTGLAMNPSTVLFVDAENKTPDNFADFMRLRWLANQQPLPHERKPLYIMEPGPIDLSREETVLWLIERVRAHNPDILFIGPIYNIIGRDVKSEDDARALKVAIDAAQKVNGCAVVLETHVPHAGPEGRDLRPIGSSLLMRWPSFGFGLKPIETRDGRDTGVSEWKAWRGARRRNRIWPEAVRMGKGDEWLWMAADPLDIEQAKAQARG